MSNAIIDEVELTLEEEVALEQRLLELSQEAVTAAEAAHKALEELHLEMTYTKLKLRRKPQDNVPGASVPRARFNSLMAYNKAGDALKHATENLAAVREMLAERQADRAKASRPAPIVELAFGLARRVKPGQVYEFQVHLSVPDDVEGWPYAEDEYVVGTSIETSDLFASWKPFPGHEEEVVIGPDNRKGFTRYLLTVGDDVDNLPRQGVVVVKVFRNGMFLHQHCVDQFTLVLDEK